MSATETPQLANFLAFVALHKGEAGRRLSLAREASGLTQQDAADAIGVDRRTIQRYEAGDIGKMATIQSLADAYGMGVDILLGGEPFTARAAPLAERLDHVEGLLSDALAKLEQIEGVVSANAQAVERFLADRATRDADAAIREGAGPGRRSTRRRSGQTGANQGH